MARAEVIILRKKGLDAVGLEAHRSSRLPNRLVVETTPFSVTGSYEMRFAPRRDTFLNTFVSRLPALCTQS